MKKLVFIGLVMLFLWLGVSRFVAIRERRRPLPSSTLVEKSEQALSLEFGGRVYSYYAEVVGEAEQLKLIANFEEGLSSSEAIDKYGCSMLSSGGFYSEKNRPIGWFVSEDKQISAAQINALFNGFVYSRGGKVEIGKQKLAENVNWGFQTGPVLMLSGETQKLKIRDDKPRRRVVLSTIFEGKVLLSVIHLEGSAFEGPYLVDLPNLAVKIAESVGVEVESAINLDGGTASVFYSGENKYISEAALVGSFLCLEPS